MLCTISQELVKCIGDLTGRWVSAAAMKVVHPVYVRDDLRCSVDLWEWDWSWVTAGNYGIEALLSSSRYFGRCAAHPLSAMDVWYARIKRNWKTTGIQMLRSRGSISLRSNVYALVESSMFPFASPPSKNPRFLARQSMNLTACPMQVNPGPWAGVDLKL